MTRFRILYSASVPVPITVGIRNPLVILPEQLLREADKDVLTSAVGHELVHVWRRDYFFNLLYELIYLPALVSSSSGAGETPNQSDTRAGL